MKKNLFYAGAFICAMAALSSCNNEDFSSSQLGDSMTVTAGMERQSRTIVEDELNSEGKYDIVWSSDDALYIYGGESYSYLKLIEGANQPEAQFDGKLYGYLSDLTNAIYPVPTKILGNGKFELELAADFAYDKHSNAPMYGTYDNENKRITFGLITSLLRVNVDVTAGEELTISMKDAAGTGNPVIAGTVTVDNGVISMDKNGEKTVKVKFNKAGNYMLDIPVPAGEYKGYTVKSGDKTIADVNLDTPQALAAGEILVASSAKEPETESLVKDEYIITDASELRWIAEELNKGNASINDKTFKLAKDIDLKNIPWTPIGTTDKSGVSFRGTFDGQGHTISNIIINENASAYDGFFASVWGATIKNVTFEGVNVEESRLAARIINAETKLENVTVNGSKVDNLFGTIENTGIVTIDGNKYIADGVLAEEMDENKLGIYSVKGFNWFAEQVNGGTNFAGKTVTLKVNIDLENKEWTPITGFKGTFDGGNKTISNLKVVIKDTNDPAGLFAKAIGATIQNLNLNDVDIQGHWMAGAIVGNGTCVKIENCSVTGGQVIVTPLNEDDGNQAGGIVGLLSADGGIAYVKKSSVDGLTIIAYRDLGGIAGTASESGNEVEVENNTVSNTLITANQTVAYYEEKAANAGELVGRNLGKADLKTNTATNVTVKTLVATAEQLTTAIKMATDEQVIVFANDIVGNSIALQKLDVDVVIDGDNHKYNGTIEIHGGAQVGNKETLTIKNVKFETSSDENLDFINGYYGNGLSTQKRYVHNVIVKDCNFKSTGSGDVVGMRFQQTYNISVKDCKAEGLHSLMWANSCGIKDDASYAFIVDNVEITNCKHGIHLGTTSAPFLVKNSNISTVDDYGYGIRVDANVNSTLEVENSTLTAKAPILIRKATSDYGLTLSGENKLNTTGEYQIIATANDFAKDKVLTKASGNITMTGADGMKIYK